MKQSMRTNTLLTDIKTALQTLASNLSSHNLTTPTPPLGLNTTSYVTDYKLHVVDNKNQVVISLESADTIVQLSDPGLLASIPDLEPPAPIPQLITPSTASQSSRCQSPSHQHDQEPSSQPDAQHSTHTSSQSPVSTPKHVVFKWPTRSGARYTLISDAICKLIYRTKHIYVQAFPGTTLHNILWDIRLGKVLLDNFEIIVIHVGTNDLRFRSVRYIYRQRDECINR